MEASAFNGSPAVVPAGARAPRASLLRLRSDEQLLALFRLGSEDAFAVLFHRYETRLLAYTRRMLAGSQQDAEDALQDVFLRAYGALRADERPVSVRAWLYRVAHNRCIDHIRRVTPAPEDVYAVSQPSCASDPEAAFVRRENLRQVVADLHALPETQRSALLLREMEGLSYVELAATLDLSMPAVKSVLVRARTSLAESSEARGTSCAEIRTEIDAALDEGVRPDARSRRHMRSCDGCTDYHTALRTAPGARAHAGPLALMAKLLGLGGATGAGTGVVGTAAAGSTAIGGKLAALVCCGMVVAGAGAAAEFPGQVIGGGPSHSASPSAHRAPASPERRTAAAAGQGHAVVPASSMAVAPASRVAGGSAPRRARVSPSPQVAAPMSAEIIVADPPVLEQDAADPAVVDEPPVAEPPVPAPAHEPPATGSPAGQGPGTPSAPTSGPHPPTTPAVPSTSPATGAGGTPTPTPAAGGSGVASGH